MNDRRRKCVWLARGKGSSSPLAYRHRAWIFARMGIIEHEKTGRKIRKIRGRSKRRWVGDVEREYGIRIDFSLPAYAKRLR